MIFSNLFGGQKESTTGSTYKKTLGFEALEDRAMLSITVAEQGVVVEYSRSQ